MSVFASAFTLAGSPEPNIARAGWRAGSICGLVTGVALVVAESLGCGAVCPLSAAATIASGIVAGGITFGPASVLEGP